MKKKINGHHYDITANHGIRNVCVYCGSGKGKNRAYATAARTLGRQLAKAGIGLVYGGGSLGLMGEVASPRSSTAAASPASSRRSCRTGSRCCTRSTS